jgi:hypothetical protein
VGQFFKFDHLYGLSKIVTELKSKPWVDHVDMPPEDSSRERRLYQVMFADLLLADLKSGKTTFSKFLSELADHLDEPVAKSSFEDLARDHIANREIKRSFLKELDKSSAIKTTPPPSLFEILVRGASRMKMRKRKSVGNIPHPVWRKKLVKIFAQETPERTKAKIVRRVKKQFNSLTRKPTLTSDHVVEKLLKDKRVR